MCLRFTGVERLRKRPHRFRAGATVLEDLGQFGCERAARSLFAVAAAALLAVGTLLLDAGCIRCCCGLLRASRGFFAFRRLRRIGTQ